MTIMNKYIEIYIYGIFLFVIALTSILYFFVFAKENGTTLHTINVPSIIQENTNTQNIQEKESHPLKQCFTLQEGRDACYFDFCKKENPYLCAEELLDTIVRIEGPEQAMEALNDIMESDIFEIQLYGHALAHVIGRATSYYLGLSEASFVRCPIDFNFGCVHGFFERALEKSTSSIEIALEICEKHPFCYHGLGHGFVYYESYNLMNALALCDQLRTFDAYESCYRGVFMENITGFFDNVDGEMGFVENDILAPCSRIEDKYRNQCWREHGRYIVHYNNWSLRDAAHFCLNAGDYIHGCMVSLGHLVTGPGSQNSLKGPFIGTHEEIAAYLCNQFPSDHITTCQTIHISNTLDGDRTDTTQASEFCLSFNVNVNDCFKKIGTKLIEVAYNNDGIIRGCTMVPEQHRESCYEGADIHKETKDTSMIYE